MKVLVVIPTIASYPFLRDMCLKLVERGDVVHVATNWTDLGQHEQDSVHVQFHAIDLPRGMNPLGHIKAGFQLKKIYKRIRPDVIDVHFSAAAFTVSLARGVDWAPILATVQGLRFPLAKGVGRMILRYAECWSASKAKKFIVLTDDDLKALEFEGVKNSYKQSAYGFGCDLRLYDKSGFSTEEKQQVAKRIGKGDEEVLFTFVGRLVAFKGFHLVVRSFIDACKQGKDVRLLICGDFDDYHPSGLTDNEISTLKGHERVCFVGWTNEVAKYLSITDVMVFPSEREGVPVILMEALSMAIPVITCDSRGCREVMDGGNNGIILSSRSAEELTKAMLIISGDPDLRRRFSQAAYQFRSNFDRNKFIDEHILLLDALRADSKGGG